MYGKDDPEVKIEGIPAFDEMFTWMTIVVEMYFGASLARRG